jgi:hypothetical protein
MDTRTLEQVIMDASGKSAAEAKGYSAVVGCDSVEVKIIADAVREWMKGLARESGHGPSGGVQGIQADRIKELEAEVERLKSSASLEKMQRDASAYRDLRERFPFWPGDEFWAFGDGKIRREVVECVSANGPMLLDGIYSKSWNWDECHPTADACRAAISVEE